ncbi:MAG: aminotransferase class V-fold PLP-dependent enzyme [Clostridiales Family XIII bacterium]|nr:aminotransferase class V-fold PLP-dependent enzyme [Clostridiales Family XIII bacterium]
MLDQSRTPIIEALKAYVDLKPAYFKVPAHRYERGVSERLTELWGSDVFKYDLTETVLTDDLHLPIGAIKEAEDLAAELFSARRSFFLVNGSTCGIEAMVIAAGRKGRIAIARNAHKAALSGLVISGAEPVFLLPEFSSGLGVFAGVSPEAVEKTLSENPDVGAFLLTSPTYHGLVSDVRAIADICHDHGALLLVDEAHGAHLYFDEKNKARGALACGADIVVQSIHKTGGSLTQSSILHIGAGAESLESEVSSALKLVQSSSPSYLLMASLDAARRELAMSGGEMFAEGVRLSDYVRAELRGMDGVRCDIPQSVTKTKQSKGECGIFAVDESRVSISLAELGLSGFELADRLFEEYEVDVEMADDRNVLVVMTYANTKDDADRLIAGVCSVATAMGRIRADHPVGLCPTPLHGRGIVALPEMVMTHREAYFAETETVAWSVACGRIAAEGATPYPPGVPIIYPGEKISLEVWNYIEEQRKAGRPLQGITDPTLKTYKVIK